MPRGTTSRGGAAATDTRSRTVLLSLFSLSVLLLLTSYSASHHQHRSPSASRVATYLPSSLSNRISRPSTLPPPPSSFDHSSLDLHPDSDHDPLAYRAYLEHKTSPPSFTTHSDTLGFDHVYVLSLPSRQDRRTDMTRLADALGIKLTFVDAANKNEPFIKWIAERVAESRQEKRTVMAEAQNVDPSTIGGLGIPSTWLTPFPSPSSLTPFPPFPSSPLYPGARDWVEHLETLYSRGGEHRFLRPSNEHLNVTEHLWDRNERVRVRQVHEGVISTYWGQVRAMKKVVENGDRTALILEDDVDVEWDLERLWEGVRRRLPKKKESGEEDWDVTLLGHCWGGESQKPQYLHPLLHPSVGPMCLHAYALTHTGASTLLSYLLSPWSAYSTAVDIMIPTLLHIQSTPLFTPSHSSPPEPLLRSWTITPPLIVQRKDGPSDLQKGNGSKWRGVLRDSTVERVQRDRGEWHEGWEEDPERVGEDPATRLRCGPV